MKFCGMLPFSSGVSPSLARTARGRRLAFKEREKKIRLTLSMISYRYTAAIVIATRETLLGYEWQLYKCSPGQLEHLLSARARTEYESLRMVGGHKHFSFRISIAGTTGHAETFARSIPYGDFLQGVLRFPLAEKKVA
jgi:hypothetical protein